jgi:dTDP-4-dehydrorhamnose reductase
MEVGCIFLTGGSGTLGKEIISCSKDLGVSICAPSSKLCDVVDYGQTYQSIKNSKAQLVIHAAAFTNIDKMEESFVGPMEVNVVGAFNVFKACSLLGVKMVLISTDHVFDGDKGYYVPHDLINPQTKYAKSKAASEMIVGSDPNNLIIRTSFYGSKSLDLESSGIVHVGSARRSMEEIALERKRKIVTKSRKSFKKRALGKDFSLLER